VREEKTKKKGSKEKKRQKENKYNKKNKETGRGKEKVPSNYHMKEVATNTSIVYENQPPRSIELQQKEKKIDRVEKKTNKKSRKKTKHNAQKL
jgi:hypothetical protein